MGSRVNQYDSSSRVNGSGVNRSSKAKHGDREVRSRKGNEGRSAYASSTILAGRAPVAYRQNVRGRAVNALPTSSVLNLEQRIKYLSNNASACIGKIEGLKALERGSKQYINMLDVGVGLYMEIRKLMTNPSYSNVWESINNNDLENLITVTSELASALHNILESGSINVVVDKFRKNSSGYKNKLDNYAKKLQNANGVNGICSNNDFKKLMENSSDTLIKGPIIAKWIQTQKQLSNIKYPYDSDIQKINEYLSSVRKSFMELEVEFKRNAGHPATALGAQYIKQPEPSIMPVRGYVGAVSSNIEDFTGEKLRRAGFGQNWSLSGNEWVKKWQNLLWQVYMALEKPTLRRNILNSTQIPSNFFNVNTTDGEDFSTLKNISKNGSGLYKFGPITELLSFIEAKRAEDDLMRPRTREEIQRRADYLGLRKMN